MKKIISTFSFILLIILSGCGGGDSDLIKVNDKNRKYIEGYDQQVQNYINGLNSLLLEFSKAVDGVYTEDYTIVQFGMVLKKAVPKSSELVESIETYEVDPELFTTQQELILLANLQHQLLLDAIEMSNIGNVDKPALRQKYLEIKQKQANFSNSWKNLMNELNQKFVVVEE
ncbi:hypothetical protein [Peribacillus loiseleuriae]|uniref:hypothetical protein n=1 Tax=Peribacillus loiseleuriae TaxID=1679170 RepID=UPI003D06D96E